MRLTNLEEIHGVGLLMPLPPRIVGAPFGFGHFANTEEPFAFTDSAAFFVVISGKLFKANVMQLFGKLAD